MDASNFSAGADLARSEVNKVASVLRQSEPPAKKFQKEIELLDRAFSEAGKQTKEYADAVEFLRKKHGQMPEAIKPTARELEFLSKAEKQAADDSRFMANIIDQTTPAIKKFENELTRLNALWPQSKRGTKEYADAVEFLRKKHGQIPPEIKKTSGAVDSLKQSMMNAVPGGNMLANALKGPAGAALALAAAAAVVAREVGKAAQRIDETAKAARSLGMAYSDLIALQMLAGEVGGIDAAGLNKGMSQFVKRIAEARVNGGQLAETMKALGLDVGKLATMDPAEAFAQVADVIQGIPDHAERVRIAVSLFGKEGLKFVEVLAQGSAGLDKMRQGSERLGTAISDEAAAEVEAMNDAWGRSKGAVEGIWNSVTTALAPALTSLAKLAEDFFVMIRMSGESADKMVPIFDTISSVAIRIIDTVRLLVALINDAGGLLAILPGFSGTVNTNFTQTNKLLDEYESRTNGTAAATKTAAEAAEALAIETQRAADEAARVQESYEKRVQQLQIESVALAGNVEEAERMRLIAEGYSQAQADSLIALQKQNALMKERAEAEKKAADDAAKQAADLAKQQERAAADRLKEIERLKKAADDAFDKEISNALAAAKKHFELEAQKAKQRRDEVAKGPGAGMEVGSADAAKFMADSVNRMIADGMPSEPEPTEKEILEEAKKQLAEAQRQTALQTKQEKALADMVTAIRENGFRRLP
jgi:colicin import membrane protein